MNRLKLILFVLLGLLTMAGVSCESDDEPSLKIPATAVYDFVTIVESSSSGATFEMQKADDSPVIRYTSDHDLASASTHVTEGDRLIICYNRTDGDTYTSGPINLYAYATLSSTEQKLLTGTSDEYDDWSSPQFFILAIWRSGTYINLQSYLYGFKDINPDKFVLVADESTLLDPVPSLHLIYKNREGNDGKNQYKANASFDISSLWLSPSCHGVVINYPTVDASASVSFMK